MPKLNDTQTILLSAASQREGGSLYPLPEQLASRGAGITKMITTLVKLDLLEERETSDKAAVAREDKDVRYGVFVTPAGLAAIGIVPEGAGAGEGDHVALGSEVTPPPARTSKTALVLGLLQREAGATLTELIEATGWLPHTTRAALTGLRKKGHAIERSKQGEISCYRVNG